MKNLSAKQSAEVPVITGGLAMDWGDLGAFVWKLKTPARMTDKGYAL